MSLDDVKEDEYYQSLHGDDIARFESKYQEIREDLDEEEIKQSLKAELDRKSRPRINLIEAVASGFSQDSKAIGSNSGFSFAFLNPFIEHVEDTADLLLVNDSFSGVSLCPVLCEVGESDWEEWSARINEIYDQFENEQDISDILRQIGSGDQPINSVEYAIVSRSKDLSAVDISQVISSSKPSNLSVWNCSRWNQELELSEGNINHKSLRDLLTEGFDYLKVENRVGYAIGTHPVIGLGEVLNRILKESLNDEEHPKEFDKIDFTDIFEEHIALGCSGEKREGVLKDETNRLISVGIEIGIISDDQDDIQSSKDYRMIFRGKKPERAIKKVEEKYLEEMKSVKREEQALKQAKQRFERQQSGVGDF